MIPHKVEREVHTGGVGDASAFTLTMSPHMASLLSDKLYSDKVGAVIREYCCNARDSNVQAGNPAPIHVHLPTWVEPWFSVKDQGIGLTFSEIGTLFCTYGASTKQGDNRTTGMFGVGSKAWAAYSDQMVVTATKSGVTERASCFKDNEGMPRFAKLGETTLTPDEPDGVTIQISVNSADVNLFREKAAKLLEFFDPLPTVNVPDFKFGGTDSTLLLKGEGWELRDYPPGNYSDLVVTGQVPYRLDSGRFKDFDISPFNLVTTVPLGSVDIAASREELSFNPQTLAYLTGHLSKIRGEISLAIRNLHDSDPSGWGRRRMAVQLLNRSSYRYTGTPLCNEIREVYKDSLLLDWGDEWRYAEMYAASLNARTMGRKRIAPSFTKRVDFMADLFKGGDIRVFLLHNGQDNPIARIKAGFKEVNSANSLLIRYPEGKLDFVRELLGGPPDDTFLDLGKYGDDDLELTGIPYIPKSGKKKAHIAHLMKFVPTPVPSRSAERSQFLSIKEEDIPKGGYYVVVKEDRIDHPKLCSSYAGGAIADLLKGMYGADAPVFAIHSHRKNWFATQKGWVNLADEFDRWCHRLYTSPRRMRKFILENDTPQLSHFELDLTKLLKYGIIEHECDKMLVNYYTNLLLHSGTNRGRNALLGSLYLPSALNTRLNKEASNYRDRTTTWRTTCVTKVKDKYPLLEIALEPTIRKVPVSKKVRFAHLTTYMEKINEQCVHHNS